MAKAMVPGGEANKILIAAWGLDCMDLNDKCKETIRWLGIFESVARCGEIPTRQRWCVRWELEKQCCAWCGAVGASDIRKKEGDLKMVEGCEVCGISLGALRNTDENRYCMLLYISVHIDTTICYIDTIDGNTFYGCILHYVPKNWVPDTRFRRWLPSTQFDNMATASSLTLLLRSWMFEVRSCPSRYHHQWWVARRSATWLWGTPSAHEGRKGIRETWIQPENILFSLMDMMMTWWYMMDHVISPCRSCGIWGDPILQMLKRAERDHIRLPLLFPFPIIADKTASMHPTHSLCWPSRLSS